MSELKVFDIGDTVKWSSQAGGFGRAKQGRVVEIVPPGRRPDVRGSAGARRHPSYVVEVAAPEGSKAKPTKFWPLVSKLQLVARPS